MPPTTEQLLEIMRAVRDSSSFVLNPHDRGCIGDGGCGCVRGRRIIAAWRAYHDALAASGVPPLDESAPVARGPW